MSLIPRFVSNAVETLNNLTHTAVTVSSGLDRLADQSVGLSEEYLKSVKADLEADMKKKKKRKGKKQTKAK